MKGSRFDGIEASRFLWFGHSRLWLLKHLVEITHIPLRLKRIKELLSPEEQVCFALGVDDDDNDDLEAAKCEYFSNTELLQRHICIIENLTDLLCRTQQIHENPEPLPTAFYSWFVPRNMGRKSADRTLYLWRFFEASSKVKSDIRPYIFRLFSRLFIENVETVEHQWLQPCTEEVALEIWLIPLTRNERDARTRLRKKCEENDTDPAIQWYESVPRLFERFQSQFHLSAKTRRWKHTLAEGDLFFKVDKDFIDELACHCGDIMPALDAKRRSFYKRWLTLWTFYYMGITDDDIHDLVSSVWLYCERKK